MWTYLTDNMTVNNYKKLLSLKMDKYKGKKSLQFCCQKLRKEAKEYSDANLFCFFVFSKNSTNHAVD